MAQPTVAIVGAGIGGVYLAADLGLLGCPLRLHDRDDAKLGDIRARGGIDVEGERVGFAAIERVTTDAAAAVDGWQCISVTCTGCGSRYLASVARRDQADDAAAVAGYPDVAGQMLLAARNLAAECPDHGYRLRVRAFTVVA